MHPALWVGWREPPRGDPGDVARSTITVERQNGEILCEHCLVADTFWTRFRGLLGRRYLTEDEGLLIQPAGSVHSFFMRFRIDVVFLDREDAVLKVVPGLQRWRLAAARRAKRTLELADGVCASAGLAAGERLVLAPRTPREHA